jgi:hypothetical protein
MMLLVSQAILKLVPPSTKVVDVGKSCARKKITQKKINQLLIESANQSCSFDCEKFWVSGACAYEPNFALHECLT